MFFLSFRCLRKHSETSILDTSYAHSYLCACGKLLPLSHSAVYIDRKTIKMEMMPSHTSQKRGKCLKFMALHFLWCCRCLQPSQLRSRIPIVRRTCFSPIKHSEHSDDPIFTSTHKPQKRPAISILVSLLLPSFSIAILNFRDSNWELWHYEMHCFKYGNFSCEWMIKRLKLLEYYVLQRFGKGNVKSWKTSEVEKRMEMKVMIAVHLLYG